MKKRSCVALRSISKSEAFSITASSSKWNSISRALNVASGHTLSETQREEFRRVQLRANRWTYLGTGMTHERVLETLESAHAESTAESGKYLACILLVN